MSISKFAIVAVLLLATAASAAVAAGDRKSLAAMVRAHRLRSGLGAVPATVPYLNVSQYLGFWHQVYTDSFNSIFEPNPYCSSALYGMNANGSVSVRNRDTSGNWTTGERVIYGWASQDDAANFPGRLSVHLQCTTTRCRTSCRLPASLFRTLTCRCACRRAHFVPSSESVQEEHVVFNQISCQSKSVNKTKNVSAKTSSVKEEQEEEKT